MNLLFVKSEMPTPSGLPARPVLTSYYKSPHFRNRSPDPFNDHTSPDEAILCPDIHQSMYCQLLAGLLLRHSVLRISAVFASALLRCISFLKRHFFGLSHDIRTGFLSSSVTNPGCREAMSALLSSPSPILADEINAICNGAWKGILCRLWPKARCIEAVLTGSMAQYVPALEYFTDGMIPLVCTMYASSECYFGVNLRPLCDPADVSYTLLPNMAYFEFLPLENGWRSRICEEDAMRDVELVNLVDVKLDCYYELVVTTFAGKLYSIQCAYNSMKNSCCTFFPKLGLIHNICSKQE